MEKARHLRCFPIPFDSASSLFPLYLFLSLTTLLITSTASSSFLENNNQEGAVVEKRIPVFPNILQKHVSFFDRNHDGVIYPWETYQGYIAIGCDNLLSTLTASFTHLAFSQKSRPGKLPSPLLPIEIENIHLSKYESDTGVFDNEGRFVPLKFEEIFIKYAHTYPNALTSDELKEMIKANRKPQDFRGWIISESEWYLLYTVAKDKDGLLQKETIRSVYDGRLFERLEREHSAEKKKQ